MDGLLKLRRSVQSRAAQVQTAVNKLNKDNVTPAAVNVHLNNLIDLTKNFKDIQEKIIVLCDDERQEEVQHGVDNDFYQLCDIIEIKLREFMKEQQVAVSVPVDKNRKTTKKPVLALPTFDGKYENWQSFCNRFKSAIHDDPTLSDSDKLMYLQGQVTGVAADLIRSFQVIDDNYKIALETLERRFDNQREVVSAVMDKLFDLPSARYENADSLRVLLDTTNECVRSLAALRRPIDQCDDFLVHLVVRKMDSSSRKDWGKTLGSVPPSFNDLCDFLEKQITSLKACDNLKSRSSHQSSSFGQRETVKASANASANVSQNVSQPSTSEGECWLCNLTHVAHVKHALAQCPKFQKMTIAERRDCLKVNGACFKCLKMTRHRSRFCNVKEQCSVCSKSHHTLVHLTEEPVKTNSFATSSNETREVLMKTIVANAVDSEGMDQEVRIFWDDGSKVALVTESFAKRLRLSRRKCNVQITGVASVRACVAKARVTLCIKSRQSDSSVCVDALVVPVCTSSLPATACNPTPWEHLKDLQLADPKFHLPAPVDVLIGGSVASQVILDGLKKGGENAPVAQNTIFGWVVSGEVVSSAQPTNEETLSNHADCVELEAAIQKFWEIEDLPTQKYLSEEEKKAEDHFTATHYREADGRYVVQYPFTSMIDDLGSNKRLAYQRLLSLERQHKRNPAMKAKFQAFIDDYISLGHMALVPEHEIRMPGVNYLPYHAVFKEDSTTTSLRVVFDGSCETTSGFSFNDCQLIGPVLQTDLFSLLLKFRVHAIVLKGDIAKMFRQFKIDKKHWKFQRILLRDSETGGVVEYNLCTVSYGTRSAPWLAIRALHQLAIDEEGNFPKAAKVIKEDSWVDDLMTGADTIEEAKEIQQQVTGLVKAGQMEMRKWASNSEEVLSSIRPELRESSLSVAISEDSTIKALGVKWNVKGDYFTFHVDIATTQGILTKRKMLREVARNYDPTGYLSPVTIKAKIMVQELWKEKLDWDTPLNSSVVKQWSEYKSSLSCLDEIQVPRRICIDDCQKCELHGFSDSSEKAFAAVLYLKSVNSKGEVTVRLVTSKTKVAPIKQASLPRLELCGAVLLVDLINVVRKCFNFDYDLYAWTDSMTVLKWLGKYPGTWETFVANRVSKIQTAFPVSAWRHVPGVVNPADLPSRGIKAEDLVKSSVWWNGPDWLSSSSIPSLEVPAIQEVATVHHVVVSAFIFEKYSSYFRLVRIFSYCLRFIESCRRKLRKTRVDLMACELRNSHSILIKLAQEESFSDELKQLRKCGAVSKNSKLKSLCPFIDSSGTLRVGGRLDHADIPEDKKHPIIMSNHHPFTKLVIRKVHRDHLHSGIQLTMMALMEEYWIVRFKETVRGVVRKCKVCRRQRAETMGQLMGSLPSPRVNPSHVFCHVGSDYAGPLMVKNDYGKNTMTNKAYVVVFVCMATKAVHLDVVSDLSGGSCVAALQRFVARRGYPTDVYSDGGTHYTGADSELKELCQLFNEQPEVQDFLSAKGINWHYGPPGGPHHNGLFEACVKSMKFHLRRVVGTTILSFTELSTLVCQIEACLNSRPICALSNDPDDVKPLTPGHFLIGRALTSIPYPDLSHLQTNRLDRWQLIQNFVQQIWKFWSNEYIISLQRRHKWLKKSKNVQVNDLCLIRDENVVPTYWRMCRVIEVYVGHDGCIRSALVKTEKGVLRRPIVKLVPILNSDDDE